VDQEVAKTLGELELKLQELERELTSLGQRDAPRHRDSPPREQANAPVVLIDEAVEREQVGEGGGDPRERATEETVAEDDGFGGPAVWGGEEVPAQAGATIERNWTEEARETAYGEIPIPPPQAHFSPHEPAPPHASPVPHHPYAATPTERQSIEMAELVEFKEKMQRTLDELIAEYSRLLSPKPPA
jgi:hypothetical protein